MIYKIEQIVSNYSHYYSNKKMTQFYPLVIEDSYWTYSFMVDLPSYKMVIFHI